jgi:HK97 gp10 family phage protein
VASGLEGVAFLTKQLIDLADEAAPKELVGIAKAAIQPALHKARSTVPQGTRPHKTYKGRLVSPGFALASLDADAKLNKRTGSAEARLGYRQEAFYAAIFLELGTSSMPAQPTLRPALESTQDEALGIIASEMKTRIDKITKRQQSSRGK